MPRDWKGPFSRRLQVRRSEHGRRMSERRWQLDRERRERLALLTAEQYPSRIIRRIVVIDDERTVREAVIWSFDSTRSARRKLRDVLKQKLPVLNRGGEQAAGNAGPKEPETGGCKH